MIVNGIATVNEIGCDPCQWPTCPAPSIECQSITVSACGYSLPEHEGIPDSDLCLLFSTLTKVGSDVTDINEVADGNTYIFSGSQTSSVIFAMEFITVPGVGELPDTRECEEVQKSTSYSEDESITDGPTGAPTTDTDGTQSSSSTGEGPCTGTYTFTDNLDAGNNDSGEFNFCDDLEGLDPIDSGFTYTSPGVFSKTFDPGFGTINTISYTYSEPVVLATLIAEVEARKVILDGADWPGTVCQSTVQFNYGYAEPEPLPDPPPDPPEPEPEPVVVCTQISDATISRYRFGVPSGFSTTEAPRTTFEVQADDYFFPTVWDAWDLEKAAYDESVADHEAWEAADPETRGDEPEVLPEPGEEPTPPVLVASRSWSWSGDMEDAKSPWYEMAIPEDTEVPGETRRVNLAVNCWNSTRYGRKPTWHGEIYTPPAEP